MFDFLVSEGRFSSFLVANRFKKRHLDFKTGLLDFKTGLLDFKRLDFKTGLDFRITPPSSSSPLSSLCKLPFQGPEIAILRSRLRGLWGELPRVDSPLPVGLTPAGLMGFVWDLWVGLDFQEFQDWTSRLDWTGL